MTKALSDVWSKAWRIVTGASPLGEAIRAVIYYVLLLLVAYVVGLVNGTAGTVLTLILVLGSIADLIKVTEANLRSLVKRLPSSLATVVVAYFLGQSLDYAFGILFFVFLLVRVLERYSR